MSEKHQPDLSLFVDILHTLESIDAPYMIIGAFAATVYGITRVTYDINIVVKLEERHIQALTTAYPPPPRYYADPVQMRDSIRMGIMFNIIDTDRSGSVQTEQTSWVSHWTLLLEHWTLRQTLLMPNRNHPKLFRGSERPKMRAKQRF